MIKFNNADALIKTAHRLGLEGFFVSDEEGIFLGQLNSTNTGWKIGDKSVHDILYPVNVSSSPL